MLLSFHTLKVYFPQAARILHYPSFTCQESAMEFYMLNAVVENGGGMPAAVKHRDHGFRPFMGC